MHRRGGQWPPAAVIHPQQKMYMVRHDHIVIHKSVGIMCRYLQQSFLNDLSKIRKRNLRRAAKGRPYGNF